MKNRINIIETNSIKGLLILLVILGHIGEIMPISYMFLLYSFHVTSFLFLPFLFNGDILSSKNIVKIFRRYYIPYTIFFLLAFTVYTLMIDSHFTISTLFLNFILGTSSSLKASIGFSLYWFFPALISLLILIMIYNHISDYGKKLFFLIVLFSHITVTMIDDNILQATPFFTFVAFYLFSIGLFIKWIYEHIMWDVLPSWMYLLALSLLLYLSYGSDFNVAKSIIPNVLNEPLSFILHDAIMIVGFFTVLKIGKRLVFLELVGKLSIVIYTIHPFLIQAFNKVLIADSTLLAIFKYIVVALSSYFIAYLLYKSPFYRYIYPR